jgi:homocysteine S-methyltransferase
MSLYRNNLKPLLDNGLFVTDAGLETELVFIHGHELPAFASFPLLETEQGQQFLAEYYRRFFRIAEAHDLGMVIETPTWRANADWGHSLGYDASALDRVNQSAVSFLADLREEFWRSNKAALISGNLGPRSDGYQTTLVMNAEQARDYHLPQIRSFADSAADMVSVFTMNYSDEALGIALAAQQCQMPVVVSFTLETDGRLPSGESLADAIHKVDAGSGKYTLYYMINCAHPTHFLDTLAKTDNNCLERIRAVRANASCKSHAELDQSTELDAGDPQKLGSEYLAIRKVLPKLSVVGGCCGTDHRHVESICSALMRA